VIPSISNPKKMAGRTSSFPQHSSHSSKSNFNSFGVLAVSDKGAPQGMKKKTVPASAAAASEPAPRFISPKAIRRAVKENAKADAAAAAAAAAAEPKAEPKAEPEPEPKLESRLKVNAKPTPVRGVFIKKAKPAVPEPVASSSESIEVPDAAQGPSAPQDPKPAAASNMQVKGHNNRRRGNGKKSAGNRGPFTVKSFSGLGRAVTATPATAPPLPIPRAGNFPFLPARGPLVSLPPHST